jgi:hypothetical protein
MSTIKKLLNMPMGQLLMIPEAIWLTGWYRFQVLYRPFSELSPKIGSVGTETPFDTELPPQVMQVRRIVRAVSKRMPWTCNCMVRALTMKKMLRRRGIDSTLYMGIALDEAGKMEAHAWLRCGSKYISGETEMERFTATTTYGS